MNVSLQTKNILLESMGNLGITHIKDILHDNQLLFHLELVNQYDIKTTLIFLGTINAFKQIVSKILEPAHLILQRSTLT